jgi:hypothetical protein
MTLSLNAAIGSIETQLNTFAEDWYEDGIPTYSTLKKRGGNVVPYIVVSYGDLVQGRDRAVAGTRGDAHDFSVRFMAVAPTAKMARQLRTRLTDKFTGFSPDHCGQMMKRGGGGIFTMTDNNDAVVAYVAPVNFRTSLTLFEVA